MKKLRERKTNRESKVEKKKDEAKEKHELKVERKENLRLRKMIAKMEETWGSFNGVAKNEDDVTTVEVTTGKEMRDGNLV